MVFFGRVCRVRTRAPRFRPAPVRSAGRNWEINANGTEIQYGSQGRSRCRIRWSGSSAPYGTNAPAFGSDVVAETLRELDIPYIALNPGASYRGLHDSHRQFPR